VRAGLGRRALAEAIGTYFLVLIGPGAVAASFTMGAVVGPVGGFGATVPAVSAGGAFVVEWLLSFVLMLVIMAVATDKRVAPGFAGIAVGLTVGFCAMAGGPLTGASMNPARSLGPAVAGGIWDAHWIYWAAPVTAMLVAVRAYEFLRPASPDTPAATVALGIEGPVEAFARQ
jgi:glycerol uptake facilitator-like aquaporin